ncbi:class I SAM-dependent methyltransferase [Kitasatospora sp. NPDC096147]|uniref:class I SAM-dependent methyltransferase n=1 Tax=Kitasatospora sp. NPDC096147 TaxID=3364093 RepID=UPI00381AAEDF
MAARGERPATDGEEPDRDGHRATPSGPGPSVTGPSADGASATTPSVTIPSAPGPSVTSQSVTGPSADGASGPAPHRPAGPEADAVRRSYDTVAAEYAERIGDELAGKPLDRALLTALLEQLTDRRTDPPALVADLGCGPGHVTGWLAAHGAHAHGTHAHGAPGVRAVGIDLSPAMVALARQQHPAAEFREGDLRHLPAADGEFGGAVALYSLIHLPPAEHRAVLAEIHRTLRPGAPLLLAFHRGTEARRLTDWWGHPVDVTFHFLDPDTVTADLTAAGFTLRARLDRAPYPHEAETDRSYLLAVRS